MSVTTHKIVGAHYRPPAKAILAVLPYGQSLIVRPEPTNPYDPNAIAVLIDTKKIPENIHETLNNEALAYGWSIETILAQAEIHLGYIPRAKAKDIRLKGDAEGVMTFNAEGPIVTFDS